MNTRSNLLKSDPDFEFLETGSWEFRHNACSKIFQKIVIESNLCLIYVNNTLCLICFSSQQNVYIIFLLCSQLEAGAERFLKHIGFVDRGQGVYLNSQATEGVLQCYKTRGSFTFHSSAEISHIWLLPLQAPPSCPSLRCWGRSNPTLVSQSPPPRSTIVQCLWKCCCPAWLKK